MCEKCFIMISAKQCKIDNEVSCIVQDECKAKYFITIRQNMLKNAIDIPIKQAKTFLKTTFNVEINLKENLYDNLTMTIENLKNF